MEDKCSICGNKSDNLCFNHENHRIPCICKGCKDACESLIDSKIPKRRKTEAINILESYITNNPDMALYVKGILRMSIANAFIQKKKTITEREKEKGKKVNKKRPNDFWTNIAALVIWIFFFILIAAGAVIGYQFYEESGLFFGALIGAIVGGIIVCFTMVLLEISKNNAKQVELLDDILKKINK